MKISFECRGKPLGAGEIEGDFVHGQLREPYGQLWVCPQCGDLWAKATIQGRPYEVWAKSCGCTPPTHYYAFPGSMILEWDHKLMQAMPRDMLLREVIIHCDNWKRFNNGTSEQDSPVAA